MHQDTPAHLALAPLADAAEQAVEQAHDELWRRFVDHRFGHILDFAGLDGEVSLPTAEECLTDKPNALSWLTPIEDGAMSGGFHLEALLRRYQLHGDPRTLERISAIVEGLLLLEAVGSTPGFIARGVIDDGVTHYAMGSNDQTTPWLCGLRRYLRSGLGTAEQRERVQAALLRVALALRDHGWRMPCDRAPFDYRGTFAKIHWESAPRLLFLLRLLGELTGDPAWDAQYQAALTEVGPDGKTRIGICGHGMVHWYATRHSWTNSCEVSCLRQLWEMETDPAVRQEYWEGLRSSAHLAADSLPLCIHFDPTDHSRFELDWRVTFEAWEPQHNEQEAVSVAERQFKVIGPLSPRRGRECEYIREPLFAAWILTQCPDRAVVDEHAEALLKCLAWYPYENLYLSQFLAVENAWYGWRGGASQG